MAVGQPTKNELAPLAPCGCTIIHRVGELADRARSGGPPSGNRNYSFALPCCIRIAVLFLFPRAGRIYEKSRVVIDKLVQRSSVCQYECLAGGGMACGVQAPAADDIGSLLVRLSTLSVNANQATPWTGNVYYRTNDQSLTNRRVKHSDDNARYVANAKDTDQITHSKTNRV